MFTILPIKGFIDQIDGFYCDGIHAGLKPNGNNDLGFIYTKEACTVAAIFTENKFQAAPLRHFLAYEEGFKTNFVLINSKNANALTGRKGIESINTLFSQLDFDLINPVMSSTGVIGNPLPIEKLVVGAKRFDLTAKNGENLSRAIMTTDAYPKTCMYEVKLEDGSSFKIGAVAKGAGMINPNLATMLCFICTDAAAPYSDIKEALNTNKETTFNAISVDGDTSTNDTVMVLANGKSNAYNKEAFIEALRLVMFDMAMLMVADGEGAKKVAAFEVKNALTKEDAIKAAKALSNSLLVKTALFGEDPNFGRIASTIGASQIACDDEKLVISYNDVVVFNKGEICFDANIEAKAADVLKKDKYKIICDIGLGEESFTAYGCDLGYKYVEINADYRS
ncbi:bifunctional glutamate N-acetyltransferase/amino-acid acetyltransferase ArgJ [Aliarcobacter cibarius]|jgi:glutamate N-acetyltransferase / amino-acid N-acetyltransferase|uniref:Arginine biosynthesis bifunctional protein ArgJ n=1 Tax=Aliarcobacter cibarius TaxID=255507 RepID=A0A5J6RGZ5_9BACT|nr:bifunctional glutamate N-acetyltransferase/amino-acid acetyltransferase ArgJ [Aliarcobacter cibarius]QEZ88637.1 bifunctional ornithine acetyltransferase / N-acetylglutamate synthase [Aliarcobacter cibarius]QKJ26676.1 bifunctional ornithine acetyltransferase / N-acetylglutamate synthase [Aliarcobacter cibarius]TLS96622.1 bifunctional glutamate N-acetyltransferase/amino-acid acetyltransferase ArgJ [Aliarcobacter cibarius]TLS97043.1 bifunctional glutamate N-acetyltransferase/amino-acid acetyltr